MLCTIDCALNVWDITTGPAHPNEKSHQKKGGSMKRLYLVGSLLISVLFLFVFSGSAFAYTYGWQGNTSSEYETVWEDCEVDIGCYDYPDYWTINDMVFLVSVTGGYQIYQGDFEGILYDSPETNPALPSVGTIYQDNYNASTYIGVTYPATSGCVGMVLPSGEEDSPCEQSTYTTTGLTYSNPDVSGYEEAVSNSGMQWSGGTLFTSYWVILY